jgi:hypothetical protein
VSQSQGISSTSSTNGVAADPQSPSTPTTTFYQQLAAQLSDAVSQTIVQVPGYADDLTDAARKVKRVAPAEFIDMTVSAVQASPALSGVNELDIVQTRDSSQFSQAFKPVVDQFLGVANRLALMIKVKEAKAGRGALRIYGVAKSLVRNPNNTHLLVPVANLKAALRKRAKVKPSTTTVPSPSTPAAPPKGGAPTT